MKKYFNIELVMTKGEDNEGFKNSTKCWVCDNNVDNDIKVRD